MLSPKKLNCMPQSRGFSQASHLCGAGRDPFLNSDVQVESAGSFHMYKSTFVGGCWGFSLLSGSGLLMSSYEVPNTVTLLPEGSDAPFCGD